MFERFLLTHLAEPVQRLREFASLLAPGGILLVQETSQLETEDPAAQSLFGGAALAELRRNLDEIVRGERRCSAVRASIGELTACV